MSKFQLIWIFLIISVNSFGQINYNFYYKPAKQEIETEISYLYRNYKFSCIYNNDKYYFDPYRNNYIVYGSLYFPIKQYYIRTQVGYGKYFDFEIAINYKFNNFEIDIGYSYVDNFIVEFTYNLKHVNFRRIDFIKRE
jgi:hypothetical protein